MRLLYRRSDVSASLPQYSYDEIKYWLTFLPTREKMGRLVVYRPEDVLVLKYMGYLIRELHFSPSSAFRVADKLVEGGHYNKGRYWVEIKGVQIGIPVEVWA